MRDGLIVGALCVFAPEPRSWTETDVTLLTGLADAVISSLELGAVLTERTVDRLHHRLAVMSRDVGRGSATTRSDDHGLNR